VVACHLEPVDLEAPVAKVHIAFHSRKDHFTGRTGGLQEINPLTSARCPDPAAHC
jgi:hypothetical protein